jgi:hypothetical protein
MVDLRLRLFVLLGFFTLLLSPVAGQNFQLSAKPVFALSVAFGDVVERVSAPAGITLLVSPDAEISGVPLCLPTRADAGRLRPAFQSFFSHRGAVSRWETVEGRPNAFRFQLSPRYNTPRLDRAYWDERLYQLFEEVNRLGYLPPEEAERFRTTDRALFLSVTNAGVVGAVRLMKSAFDGGTIRRILRGEIAPRLSIGAIGDEAVRQRALQVYEDATRFFPDKRTESPGDTWLEFGYLSRSSRASRSTVVPELWIKAPLKNGKIVGLSFIGLGMDQQAREEIQNYWLVEGDEAHDAEAEKKSVTLKGAAEGAVGFLQVLREISEQAGVPVLAILPHGGTGLKPRRITGDTAPLSEWLRELASCEEPLLFKWREGVLLVCPAAWFTGQMPARGTPLETLRRIRAARNAEGYVPISDLIPLVAELSAEQLRLAGAGELYEGRCAADWHELIRWYDRNPESLARLREGREVIADAALRRALQTVFDAELERRWEGREIPEAERLTVPTGAVLTLTEEWDPEGFPPLPDLPKDALRLRRVSLRVRFPNTGKEHTLRAFVPVLKPEYRQVLF